MPCYYEFEFCFSVRFFSYPFEKKLGNLNRRFKQKNVTLDKLCFFLVHWNYSFFSKSQHFLYFFIRHLFHFSAHKCSLCQTMACTDRKSHKQKLVLLWGNKLLKKDRDAFLTFCFSNPQAFGNVKRASSVYFAGDKCFRQISAMPLPCFVQQNFCSMAKRNWEFSKISDEGFLKLLLWKTKSNFWHPCGKFYQGGQNCFVRCPNMLNKNLFFLDSSSPMVLPDR